MKQAELIQAIATQVDQDPPSLKALTKTDIERVLFALGTVALAELAKGGELTLPSLGKLSVKQRAAKVGRNPKTGESLTIPARRVAAFSVAKALKDALE